MSKPVAFSLAATILWGFRGIGVKLAAERKGALHSALIYSCVSFLTILMIYILSEGSLGKMSSSGVITAILASVLIAL